MKKDAIDMKDVLERVQDDRELLMELLDIFENDYPKKRKRIDELIKKNNFVQLREVGHSLKGAAGNISAKAVQATCAKIEQWAEKQDMKSITGILGALDKQFSQLQAHIAELKKDK